MTLQEAIHHALHQAHNASCEECRKEHMQLAKWLQQLDTGGTARQDLAKLGFNVAEERSDERCFFNLAKGETISVNDDFVIFNFNGGNIELSMPEDLLRAALKALDEWRTEQHSLRG